MRGLKSREIKARGIMLFAILVRVCTVQTDSFFMKD